MLNRFVAGTNLHTIDQLLKNWIESCITGYYLSFYKMKFKSIEPCSIAVWLVTPVSVDRNSSVGVEIMLLAGRVRKRRWVYDRTRSFYVLRSVETGEHTLSPSLCLWRCGPTRAMASSFLTFLDHTRRITVCRTPLDAWSALRRDLYLTTYNTHNRQTSMPPVGLEPRISAGERTQTYFIERAATGIGGEHYLSFIMVTGRHLRRESGWT